MPSGKTPHLTNAADIFVCDNRCVFIENGQLYSIITTDIPIKLWTDQLGKTLSGFSPNEFNLFVKFNKLGASQTWIKTGSRSRGGWSKIATNTPPRDSVMVIAFAWHAAGPGSNLGVDVFRTTFFFRVTGL